LGGGTATPGGPFAVARGGAFPARWRSHESTRRQNAPESREIRRSRAPVSNSRDDARAAA